MERKGERSREEALSELTNKIMSFTADELDEFIRLASQALNQPLVIKATQVASEESELVPILKEAVKLIRREWLHKEATS